MSLLILNGPTIPAGQSLSDEIDCTAGNIMRLTMPADWTFAQLTFQASSDGVFYNDLFYHDGREVIFEVVPGSAVLVPIDTTSGLAFLKFRSGTHDHPKAQAAERVFSVALEMRAAADVTPALKIKLVP
jgi:hypothetical protein